MTSSDSENNIQCEPLERNKCTSASGGAKLGPLSRAKAAGVIGLLKLFFYILCLLQFQYIAEYTSKYAYNDWVASNGMIDCNGNTTKYPILTPTTVKVGEQP